ncbi:MAG: hypothetical protein KA767_05280 [Saprospiraceae bacterium]|nr:hypothetical protein [Saprospiraceae bacterium]MBP7642728.1 hypothetical protein [Saprospiraceae bacterium]
MIFPSAFFILIFKLQLGLLILAWNIEGFGRKKKEDNITPEVSGQDLV